MPNPVDFPETNVMLGAGQEDQYIPLPAFVNGSQQREVVVKFQLSVAEMDKLVESDGCFYLTQLTFGNAFQPVLVTVEKPYPLQQKQN